MLTDTYRPMTDIADEWSRDADAPGSRAKLFSMLVSAMCDGAFYENGIAVRAHALLLAKDPDIETYNPNLEGAKRLPELEPVSNPTALHSHFTSCLPKAVPHSIADNPEAFFDWLKGGGLDQLDRNGRLAFNYIAISGEAFAAWCRDANIELPPMVGRWLGLNELAPARSKQKKKRPSSQAKLTREFRKPARIRVLNILEDGPPTVPNRDLISLCEGVTFLATGATRKSATLRRFMGRQGGGREPKGLWNRMEREADVLLSFLRRGDLTAYGSLDSGPIEPVPKDYFVNDVFSEFARDLLAHDPSISEGAFGRTGIPTYRDVRFLRSDFADVANRHFLSIKKRQSSRAKQTFAAESRCRKWLIELMKNGDPKSAKAVYQAQATDMFGTGPNQFNRAWAMARSEVGNPMWGKPGRRR